MVSIKMDSDRSGASELQFDNNVAIKQLRPLILTNLESTFHMEIKQKLTLLSQPTNNLCAVNYEVFTHCLMSMSPLLYDYVTRSLQCRS